MHYTTGEYNQLPSAKSTTNQISKDWPSESVLALIGALLGLSVVLLAAVTTGWVCTCIYMKSKLAMDQSQQTR